MGKAGERTERGKSFFRDRRVGLLLGGAGGEREISLKSGAAVHQALSDAGYEVITIDASADLFARIRDAGVEVAFIALHGGWGENGSVQGGLEVMGIPYTGSGVLASAIAMDKITAKKIFVNSSIPTPAFTLTPTVEGVKELKYPLVVKPASGGSTLGLSIVRGPEDLPEAVRLAGGYGRGVLVEEYVEGREVSVSIFDGEVYPVVEIFTGHALYDFKAKYSDGGADFKVPADLTEAHGKLVSSLALKAYEELGCRGAARVDILIDRDGNPFVLEINTSPGLTKRSLLPMAAAGAGVCYRDLVVKMLEGASLDRIEEELDENEKQGC